jgi:pilus assembly protein CpaF
MAEQMNTGLIEEKTFVNTGYSSHDYPLDHITRKIADILDLNEIYNLKPSRRMEKMYRAIKSLIKEERLVIGEKMIPAVVRQIYEETFELGPISSLMHDEDVSEIMVNNWNDIYVEVRGELKKTGVTFKNGQHLRNMIERVISPLGLRIDESSPMVDARLPDGSRINVVIKPVAISDLVLTIRKFKKNLLNTDDLIATGTINSKIADFIRKCVECNLNIVVSGASSTGKTTFLNILSNYIPPSERIITIEETLELNLNIKNIVRLESRPANIEGRGQISLRDLVRNALRMRPDRIVVGEVRGIEAVDILQAMNTGHEGSMTSIHANNPVDLISRLETMLLMSGINLTPSSARRIIASSIDLIIHLERIENGRRILSRISELSGNSNKIAEDAVLEIRDIFKFTGDGEKSCFEYINNIPFFVKKNKSRSKEFDFKAL